MLATLVSRLRARLTQPWLRWINVASGALITGFGVQSLLTLWWPINALYLLAGVIVCAIAAGVARAILIR